MWIARTAPTHSQPPVVSHLTLLALLFLGLALVAGPAVAAPPAFEIDVACNANSFSFQGPTHPDGTPDYGASFVVQGVIYPAGTLAADLTGNGGLLPDGTPVFPHLVIGTWTCRGVFIGDGMATLSGPFVITHQLYDFFVDEPGRRSLTSDGIELIDLGVTFKRAVTGGTGRFKNSTGQVFQTAIGANGTGLFNFRFAFEINPPRTPF